MACDDLKKFLNEKLYKNNFQYSKSRYFLISSQRMSIIAESRMFLKRLLSCQSFSIIRPWLDIAKTKREKQVFCCREVDAMLIASAKIPEHQENISLPSFYGQQLLFTRISLIYLVDEFFQFLVQLKKTRTLSESKVLSFCF